MQRIKRPLAALFALCLCASPALAVPSVVQSSAGTQTGGAGSSTYAVGSPTTASGSPTTYSVSAGHAIIGVCGNYTGGGGGPLNAGFDGTNTYTAGIPSVTVAGANLVMNVSYSLNVASITNGNFTCFDSTNGSNVIAGVFIDLAAVNTSGAFEATPANNSAPTSTATPSVTSGGANTAVNGVWVGCVFEDNVSNSLSAEATGWTTIPHGDTFGISSATAMHCASKIVTTSASQTYNPTFTTSTSWGALIFFIAAPGGGAATPHLLFRPIP